MTNTQAPPGLDRFRPSDWHVQWVASNWGWTDLTADELRCLWVLERYLAERNLRFYHLPEFTDLGARRIEGNRAAFQVPMPGELSSYDNAGLASLTIAAFAAAVRVQIGLGESYVNWADEEPRRHWTREGAEARARERFVWDNGGPLWFSVGEERYQVETHADLSTALLDTYESRPDDDIAYGTVDADDAPCDVRSAPILVMYLHARQGNDPGLSFYERHPGTEYLTGLIDRYTSPTPPQEH